MPKWWSTYVLGKENNSKNDCFYFVRVIFQSKLMSNRQKLVETQMAARPNDIPSKIILYGHLWARGWGWYLSMGGAFEQIFNL